VEFEILDPVGASADSLEIRRVASLTVSENPILSANVLFDPGHSLEERIFNEQFV